MDPPASSLAIPQKQLAALFGVRQVNIAGPRILNNPYRRKTIERDLKVLYGR